MLLFALYEQYQLKGDVNKVTFLADIYVWITSLPPKVRIVD